MDVELPDGTVVEGVPDGLSQRDLVSMLSKNGHNTSWYKAPEPGLIDRVKSAFTPDTDREPMPSTSDTLNEQWTSPKDQGIVLPGSVMDGYIPKQSDEGMPVESGMGPMRKDYHDTTRAGLISSPLAVHGQAEKAGGQVGKVAAATIDDRRAHDGRIQSGDTTPRTSQELTDDTNATLTAQPLRTEAVKDANRQWLTENSKAVIEGLKRSQHFQHPDDEAQDEFDRMVRNGYKPDWLLEDMPGAKLSQAAMANIGATGPALQKALLGLSEAAADQPFLQLPWQDYAKRTPRELEAMVGDLDKQIRAARNVGGKIESGSWNDVVSSMGPSLAVNLPPLVAAALVAAKNPAAGMAIANGGLGVMGLQKFGDNYLKGQMNGLSAADNLAQASLGMAAEVIPEKLSLNALFTVFKTMGKGAAVETVKAFAKQQLTEHSTEQITTIADHLIDKAYTEPNKSLESLWSDMKQTAMATAIQAPILAGGGMMAHGAGQVAMSAQQRLAEGRDLTAGMQSNPDAIDAAARQALDPANAQMQREGGLISAPAVPRATPADILAAPGIDTAIAAAAESVAAPADAIAAAGLLAEINESQVSPPPALTPAPAPLPVIEAQPEPAAAPIAAQPAPEFPVGRLDETAVAAAPVDSYLAQNAAGKWQLSRSLQLVPLSTRDAVIAEMDRRNQEGSTNAAQAPEAQQIPKVQDLSQAAPARPALPDQLNGTPPNPAPKTPDAERRPVLDDARQDVPQPAPVAASVPDAAAQDQGSDRRAISRDNPIVGDRNPVIVDSNGIEYQAFSQRHDLVIAHPIVDGKAQVNRDSAVRFWTNPDTTPSGENDRIDPIFMKQAAPIVNQIVNQQSDNQQNPEASRPNPVAESIAPAPSEPGEGGVAPTQDKAAPAITRTKAGKLEISGFAREDVAETLKTAKIPATVTVGKDGRVLVSAVSRSGNPAPLSVKQGNAIQTALMGKTAKAPKARKFTGNLRNDVNLIAPGLYAEVSRGGDGEGMAGVDMSLVAERLRDQGFMLPETETGKDSDAVIEIIRQDIANGGGTLNEARMTAAMTEAETKAHRADVLRLADEYGIPIKKGIIPRALTDIENDLAAAIEEEIGVAGRAASSTYDAAIAAGIPESELDAIIDRIAVGYTGDTARDVWVKQYREQANAFQEAIDANQGREGRDTQDEGAGDYLPAPQGSEERPALELAGQTPEQLRAEQERELAAQAQAHREEVAAIRGDRAARNQAEKDRRAADVIAEDKARRDAELAALQNPDAFEFGADAPAAPAPVIKKVSTEQARGQGDIFGAAPDPMTAFADAQLKAAQDLKAALEAKAPVADRIDTAKRRLRAATTDEAKSAIEREIRQLRQEAVAEMPEAEGIAQPQANPPAPISKEDRAAIADQYGEAYARGYMAHLDGFSIEPASDIRSKADKESFKDGWIAAKDAKGEGKPLATQEVGAGETAKIGDFGEKIGGAKKDIRAAHKDAMQAAEKVDIAAEPLSKSWPAPDYRGLIEAGADPFVVAFMRSARDAISRKPSKSWKLKGWVAQVELLRKVSNGLLNGLAVESAKKQLAELSEKSSDMRRMAGRIELYELVGHRQSLDGVSLNFHHYTLYKGEKNVSLWTVEKEAAATAMSNWPHEIATGKTKDEVLSKFKAMYDKIDINPPTAKEQEFVIYVQDGKYYVGKKLGRNPAQLAGPFVTVAEARAYRTDNAAQLAERLAKFKEIPRSRRESNEPRVGEDMRNGQDVTPEMFMESFGFRGVEFGNWVEQKKRQKDLNEAFDALMDMAAILGVPAKALSLNGELGLAFGARGNGGVEPAAAHYESDKIVINLTKKAGAGSLGHEFFHALDNYFSRMRGKAGDFTTEALDVSLSAREAKYHSDGAIRKEMVDAFGGVMRAIKNTALKARSSKLDAKRSKSYWTTDREMAARAFESYLISKLQDQNAANDYLANIVDEETWAAAEKLGFELDESYPYPTAGEVPAIRAGFDNFFQTIKTKETDKGIALESTVAPYGNAARDSGIPASATEISTFRNTAKLKAHPEYAAAKSGDYAAAASLIADLVKPENIEAARAAFGDGAIYAYPHAEEATGRNAIPGMLANYYAAATGGEVAEPIIQTNRAYHTGAGMMERMISRPTFSGDVKPGNYVLVDDVSLSGSTLAELAHHITSHGGTVSGIITLTDASRTSTIIPDKRVIKQIKERFGDEITNELGIKPEALTAAEAGYIIGFRDADSLRARVATARRERLERLRSKGVSASADQGSVESPRDVYATLETRPGTTDQQRDEGRAALDDIERAERRIFGPASSLRGNQAAVLGSAISRDFREDGGTSFVGQTVTTTGDLAMLGQVVRDPRFETFRVFYTDAAGKILGQGVYSSRLPGVVYLPENFSENVAADKSKFGATSYWMMHNHPSGRVEASRSDEALTADIASNVDGFAGHVILDHNEYGVVEVSNSGGGDVGRGYAVSAPELASKDLRSNPEVPHAMLGETINNPTDFARIGKKLQVDPSVAVLVGVDASNRINLIVEVADWALGNNPKAVSEVKRLRAMAAVRRAARQTGLSRIFAVVPGSLDQYQAATKMSFLTDVVDIDGKSAASQGRMIGAGALPVTKANKTGLKARASEGIVEASQAPYGNLQQALPNTGATPPPPPTRQTPIGLQGGASGNNASWNALPDTKLDDVIRTLQDKHIDSKRTVQAIKAAGRQVADKWDVYLQETLFHGRAAKRTLEFVETELTPLAQDLAMRGLSLAELDEYLHARHAEEANALIATRNPSMPDGGSGMTNKAARDYFANLDQSKRKRLEASAKRVDAIIDNTRQLYVSYGLESKETIDAWADTFDHYVPLMREDKDGGMGIGQGFSIKGKESKSRTGSTRKVVDILANIAMQRERAITRGEKNRVSVSLMGLAKLNPNPDFWQFNKVPTITALNTTTGLVETYPDPTYKSQENVIVAKIPDGKGGVQERAVIFNEDNEQAMNMARALKNLDVAQLEGLMGSAATITRYFASINTQYNPVFGVTNLVRDVQDAMLNLSSTPIAGHKADVLKHTLGALRGIYIDTRQMRKGQPATSAYAQLWEEFQHEGGQTGYRDMFRTSADRAHAIEKLIDPHGWNNSTLGKIFTAGGLLKGPFNKAQDMAGPLFDWLSDYNESMENAVRLAAYKVGKEQGMSNQRAAEMAKSLTVNFNRKGSVAMQAGALYAFFNASMQGTGRIAQTLFDIQGNDIKTARLSKAGKAIVAGGILWGAMQALMLAAMGFDDDEPPEFVRERNTIIPIGNKKYITIPMPLGFAILPNIGRIATEFTLGGFKNPGKHMTRLLGIAADAFNPIGGNGSVLQMVTPTALDPLAAIAENKDWTKKPIAKVAYDKTTPGHKLWKDTASTPSKLIAEAINTMSGGTKHVAGVLSPTPDQIDYLFGQVTGGVGRELSKTEQSITATVRGEDLPPHKIPLVGRFYGDAGAQSSQSTTFYNNINRINEYEAEIKGLRKEGKGAEAAKFISENPEARMVMRANYAEKQVQKLRKEKHDLVERDAPRERIKGLEDRIKREMEKLNEAVKTSKQREKEAA